MNTPKLNSSLMLTTAIVAALFLANAANAASAFYFGGNQSYLKASNSPYGTNNVELENFEDGVLDMDGVTVNKGKVKGPSSKTDSVDKDDGKIDGKGKGGHSYSSGSSKSLTFKFSGSGNNSQPTMAGLVWTDGKHDSKITFRAWDKNGDLIGKIKVKVGDLVKNGTTAEDRFLGLVSDKGISKIQISSNYAGFEIDHLQFAYGFAVVPLPSAAALGVAGLAGMGLVRRRRRDAE